MRILVVEDEHRIANSIKKGLEQERYAVDLAYTGSEGYDLASTEDYDLIILDLLLPQMDGITICRAFLTIFGDRWHVFLRSRGGFTFQRATF